MSMIWFSLILMSAKSSKHTLVVEVGAAVVKQLVEAQGGRLEMLAVDVVDVVDGVVDMPGVVGLPGAVEPGELAAVLMIQVAAWHG